MKSAQLLAAAVVWGLSGAGCAAVLSWPSREPRSGTLLGREGAVIPNATLEVDTFRLSMPLRIEKARVHHLATRTDERGRFTVPGGSSLTFTILGLPEAPGFEDEYHFRAPQRADLIGSPDRAQ